MRELVPIAWDKSEWKGGLAQWLENLKAKKKHLSDWVKQINHPARPTTPPSICISTIYHLRSFIGAIMEQRARGDISLDQVYLVRELFA